MTCTGVYADLVEVGARHTSLTDRRLIGDLESVLISRHVLTDPALNWVTDLTAHLTTDSSDRRSVYELAISHKPRRCGPGQRFAGAEPVSGEWSFDRSLPRPNMSLGRWH